MISDIREFCRLFYQTTAIPIHFFTYPAEPFAGGTGNHDDKQLSPKYIPRDTDFSYPEILANHTVFQGTLDGFFGFSLSAPARKNPDYFVSASFSYFGFVEYASGGIIIGPVYSTPVTDLTVRYFMKEWMVSLNYKEEITGLLSSLPLVSFHRFLNTLACLEYCLNDRIIDVGTHFSIDQPSEKKTRAKVHSAQVFENREDQTSYHNTWDFEQKMLRFIREGAPEKLKELLKMSADLSSGTMADNSLRQRKNILITMIALVTRSAISGGMEMEEAYQLADLYILDCERSQSVSYISELEYAILIDFAERVERHKIPKGISQEIFRAIQYIKRNVNAPIQTSDVAEELRRSRSWLSTCFKKETGFDLGEYIMRCKLEEAKSLLQFSDKTLSEISAYLCFSSQSYFQNVFKKKYGMTPRQYRDKARII